MRELVEKAAKAIRSSKKALAISHIDADGITALSIVVEMLKRENLETTWRNIHQLNSETILDVLELVNENEPDLVLFSDLGTGQMELIMKHLMPMKSIKHVIVLDHHLPSDERSDFQDISKDESLIEINPCQHGMSGSYDLSGAGVAFLLAIELSEKNVDLSELAIVGATGDLQDYYGKGFKGINEHIMKAGQDAGYILVEKDLTFFGINTRPLPYLLEYATEPYLPGITGNRDHCFGFLNELGIELKDDNDSWRTWTELDADEKQAIIQGLFSHILETYDDPKVATGIVGDVVTLIKRPARTEMRTAKEFSTLLNACGRNRRPEIGVQICLSDENAFRIGKALLQQHRANLAGALRRLETDGYLEEEGMYVVRDPQTPDTIIGIVIGMAQGSRIVPIDKPIIGVSTNTTGDGPLVKISGRARRNLVKRGINLKDAFTDVGGNLNDKYQRQVVEAGGHPMAAGAFVHTDFLEEFLELVSFQLAAVLN
jgi:RecJ-like exonuclease